MGRYNSALAVIVSADLAGIDPAQNMQRTMHMEKFLLHNGYEFKKVVGCYKGVKEASFVVIINTVERLETIKKKAIEDFNQYCILLLNQDRTGMLLYAGNRTEQLPGTLQQVSSIEGLDAYTIDQNTIYTFKE